jgi:hypothetical protein
LSHLRQRYAVVVQLEEAHLGGGPPELFGDLFAAGLEIGQVYHGHRTGGGFATGMPMRASLRSSSSS